MKADLEEKNFECQQLRTQNKRLKDIVSQKAMEKGNLIGDIINEENFGEINQSMAAGSKSPSKGSSK